MTQPAWDLPAQPQDVGYRRPRRYVNAAARLNQLVTGIVRRETRYAQRPATIMYVSSIVDANNVKVTRISGGTDTGLKCPIVNGLPALSVGNKVLVTHLPEGDLITFKLP